MEQLNIQITDELRNRLNSKNWKATEELAMLVAKEVYEGGTVDKIIPCNSLQHQLTIGDFILLDTDGYMTTVEVKTSSTYTKNKPFGILSTDYQFMDYKYFTKDSNFSKEYNQKTTHNSQGWLCTCNSDVLITYNHQSKDIYFISDFQNFKCNLLAEVDNYFMTHSFEDMDDEVGLNSFVSLTKNYYDKYKNTISVCFLLNETSIEKYGGIPYIVRLNFVK